jgi:PAS domain S-box-containing protein
MTLRVFGKSIKTQLTILLFGLTAVSILVVGFLGVRAVLDSGTQAQQITGSAMQNRVEQFLVETTNATASKNSVIFKNIQLEVQNAGQYTQNILDHPSAFANNNWRFGDKVQKLPAGQYTNSATEQSSIFIQNTLPVTPQIRQEMELTSYLDYVFPQVLKREPNAVALYFQGAGGQTRYYPNINLASLVPADFDPNANEFFIVATPENNPKREFVWSKVYDDPAGHGLTISAVHPLYSPQKSFQGIVAMDVALSNIAKNIESYSPIESSYAFLIDNAGRAIALPKQGYQDILNRAPSTDEFGSDLSKASGDFAHIVQAMRNGDHGFREVATADKTEMYVAFAPIEGTSFSLGIAARQSAMLSVVGAMRDQVKQSTHEVLYYQILPSAVIILFMVWIIGFLYIRLITGPIIALTEQARRVTKGDFKQGIAITSENEIGRLAQTFNTMTAQLAESYRNLENKVRELSAAKAKDDAMLNSIGDGVIVADSTGKTLLINEAAADMLGLDREKAVGTKLADLELQDDLGENIPTTEHPLHAALQTGKRIKRDLTVKKRRGKVAVSILATPVVQHGATIGAIQIIRDVTREKEIDRMKSEFISLASHQLRTPLSAIKWFIEMLQKGDAGKLNKEQAEYVANVDTSTDRMIKLVGALLNISRIESGRIIVDPKPVNLEELVNNIIGDLKGELSAREQKLTVTVDPAIGVINLDPRLIGQVYLNLLTNAIKYTPKGGSIKVEIKRHGHDVLTAVTDNGYGIPKVEQTKIFQKFFRATNILHIETDGTGLGMYLVKSIVESAGGKVWFKSTENKGTTFWFSMPMSGMKPKAGEVTIDPGT